MPTDTTSTSTPQFDRVVKQLRDLVALYDQGQCQPLHFHRWLGILQREAWLVLHPQHIDDEQQVLDARKAWMEFTCDTRVIQFCEAKQLTLQKGRMWYWVRQQREGEINGLPGTRGTPRISNGVDVWIEKLDGTMFLGHIDWFKSAAGGVSMGVNTRKRASTRVLDTVKEGKLQGEALRVKVLEMLGVTQKINFEVPKTLKEFDKLAKTETVSANLLPNKFLSTLKP